MNMDYLFFLQGIRETTNGMFDEFFNMISKIAVDIMPLLPFLIYWAVDKNWGYRFMGTLRGGELVNGTVKLSVCAYRPWIRDSRIVPAGDSKVAATGYSFPSGHTMCAASLPVMTGVGTACVFIWEQYLSNITFKVWFGAHWGNLLSYLILMVLAVAVYPLIIMKSAKKSGAEAA